MILIVDDDQLFARALGRRLGCDVVVVDDVDRGCELAKELQPSAILLDNLVGSDLGVGAIGKLRFAAPMAAVFLMSADLTEFDKTVAYASGAVGVCHKLDRAQFDDVIERIRIRDASSSRRSLTR